MIVWFRNFGILSLRQLSLLWVALTISVNLNPERSVWVLLIIYGMLYAAVSGFQTAVQFGGKKKYTFIIWYLAAGLLGLAAFFSLREVNLQFFILLLLYGLGRLAVEIFLPDESTWKIFASAGVDGTVAFIMIFVGINDFTLEQSARPAVILAGITLSLLFLALNLVKRERTFSTHYFTSLATIFLSAFAILVFFGNYISSYYAWPLLAIVSVAVYFVSPFNSSLRHSLLKRKQGLQWLYIVTVNGYLFFVFTAHTHILQLVI